MRRAQSGSRAAAAALFDAHWSGVWRTALAITRRAAVADDVAQDAFERAFTRIASCDPARPFAPWLHKIAANRALDVMRAERRLVPVEEVDSVGHTAESELTSDIVGVLAALSAERRAVVVLRYLLGYTPREIAGMLDVPEGTVHSRLSRALGELRELLPEGPA